MANPEDFQGQPDSLDPDQWGDLNQASTSASEVIGTLPPTNILDLFFAPTSFFTQRALGMSPHYLLAAWIAGIARTIDRIDRKLTKVDLGGTDQSLDFLIHSWGSFWATILIMGAIGAVLLWLIAGWWYRKRLNWSGDENAAPFLARLVFTYSSLITALPSLIAVTLATCLFADYEAYWLSSDYWSLGLIIFPFWSIWVSYRGVMARFDVKRGKALLWFVLLPTGLYAFGFAAIIFAYTKMT